MMYNITTRMQEIIKERISNAPDTEPLSKIKTVYDGNPVAIGDTSLPAIWIEGLLETSDTFSRTFRTVYQVEIGVAWATKDFYNSNDSDTVLIKKKVQEIIGKSNCDGSPNDHTIRGILTNLVCLYNSDNTCKLADDIRIDTVVYEVAERQPGFVSWEGKVVVNFLKNAFK